MAPTYNKVPYDNDLSDEYTERRPSWAAKSSLCGSWLMRLTLVMSLAVNTYLLWMGTKALGVHNHQLFSPAISAIAYENVVTTSGFGTDVSPYQGPPTPEKAELWRDLYNFGISRIPMKDAAKLPNRTVPIGNDPGYYAVSLDVFHELHCLNAIRLRVYDEDPDGELQDMQHLDHCIDMLRQNIMCSADITPLPFVWDRTAKKALAVGKVIRTCRKFDKIRQWGIDHQVREFNPSIYVDDPLGNMEIH